MSDNWEPLDLEAIRFVEGGLPQTDIDALIAEIEILRQALSDILHEAGRVVMIAMTRIPHTPDDPELLDRRLAELKAKMASEGVETDDRGFVENDPTRNL